MKWSLENYLENMVEEHYEVEKRTEQILEDRKADFKKHAAKLMEI